ncbi:unnamed protein product [Moneuplotes crassus]|uniref:tubulin-glutamate carboxypeptidase n=1 Tax=Euplotes crassus TaxID=5936 RepID=A0AAD1TZ93_EUPCR|nr:unnamed protein product [Moneuplotes crassus]
MESRKPKSSTLSRKKQKNLIGSESQNFYSFGSLVISSKFDTGNILDVCQISDRNFIMTTASDGEPYRKPGKSKAWYHFSITGFQQGETYNFCLRMPHGPGLINNGLKPVFKIVPEDETWKFIPGEVEFDKGEESSLIQFRYTFECSSSSTVHFAYSFPFGYEDVLKQMDEIQHKLKDNESIYFFREHVGYSLEKRKVELITITDHSKKTDQTEPFIRRLFPTCKNKKISKRGYIFKKPTIFFSARVHPGEVAASFMLNGILDVLTDPDHEYGKLLRKHFVFKIIPLLNPDGVYRGYYRQDTMGNNLNRFYKDPKFDQQPTIYIAKQIINQLNQTSKFALYIDLHAHASKKGCFMFGNSLSILQQQVENMALPKAISLNSIDFDFNQCSFAAGNMKVKDKGTGMTRDGCGRVAIWSDTGIPNSYTLECHYTVGVNKNTLTDIIDVKTKEVVQKAEDDKEQTDPDLVKAGTKENPYTIDSFFQVGKAVCVGILDYYELNAHSRLPSSELGSMKNVRIEMRRLIEERKKKKASNENNPYNRLYNRGNSRRQASQASRADKLPPLPNIANKKCDGAPFFGKKYPIHPQIPNKSAISSNILLSDVLLDHNINKSQKKPYRASSSIIKQRNNLNRPNLGPTKIPLLKSIITPSNINLGKVGSYSNEVPKIIDPKLSRKSSKSMLRMPLVRAVTTKEALNMKIPIRASSSLQKI